jgi:hypothetical protein
MRCTDLSELHRLTVCHTKFLLLGWWWQWGFSNTLEPLLSWLRLTVPLTGMQFLSTFSARAEL